MILSKEMTEHNPNLKNITTGQFLRKTAKKYPGNKAVIFGGREISYDQLDKDVDLLSKKLLGLGINRGCHVGVLIPASMELVEIIYALGRIGSVSCLINPAVKHSELDHALISGDIRTLIFSGDIKNINTSDLENRFDSGNEGSVKILKYSQITSSDPVSEEDLNAAEKKIRPKDSAMILFTTGTTGRPKPVISSHYSRVNSGIMQAKDMGVGDTDVFLCALPLFHCFSLSVNMFSACAVGGCLCIPASHHTEDLLDAIEENHCTVFCGVPAMFRSILKRPDFSKRDLSSVRVGIIGGSMYPPSLFAEIEKKIGMTLLSSLGMTEATGGITISGLNDSLEVRSSTVGHFMDFTEGKIVDFHTGIDLPVGETGEICVKGYMVMQGYYNMPEENAKAIDVDGWLHTGDMGFIDASGNLHMTGRIKELIIRGGENISPIEIEKVFENDDRVSCCKAIGVPDEHYGEEICLFVEPSAPSVLNENIIKSSISSQLSDFKVPKYVEFIDHMPRTSTGKILDKDLLKLFNEKERENSNGRRKE